MYKTSKESRIELKLRLMIVFGFVFLLLLIGTFFYHFMEGWTFSQSLYFSTISLVSRGFFDLYPSNIFSVIFSVFYLLIGVGIMIYAVSTIVAYYISFYQQAVEKKASELINKLTTKKKKIKPKEKWYILKEKGKDL